MALGQPIVPAIGLGVLDQPVETSWRLPFPQPPGVGEVIAAQLAQNDMVKKQVSRSVSAR
jgi:hypothetical protein